MIFATWMVAFLATISAVAAVAGGQPAGFAIQLALWLWATVLFANIAEDIRDVPEQIQRRQIGLFLKVDPAYGKGVADALGLKLD